ncbi:hypothetical protein CspeluHIS016_0305150 [Cutaneotrichosporon spelunceum]|uniref:Uncharacterized protein n=1 Tax=Cutaneotrichosporon spelunceum TaxID=1672016 RepID=A0AAD3YB40_9TREE|nr:hypothetical protein CspeluHIS016_0305150 [Cutaneotrichosporon spelunceum]
MGAVLSLPFFRRRTRRRRAPVPTPISHPRPLLRRKDIDLADQLKLEKPLVSETHHSASTASMGSRIVRSGSASVRTARRTRRRPGEFGQHAVPDVLEPNELSVPTLLSVSASDGSCSSKPILEKALQPASPGLQPATPGLQPVSPQPVSPGLQAVSPQPVSPGLRPVSPALQPAPQLQPVPQPLPLPVQAARPGSVAGPKQRRRRPSTRCSGAGTRRTSAKRRIESGWDIIRHDEADGWAPAAGRSRGKRVRLAWPGA